MNLSRFSHSKQVPRSSESPPIPNTSCVDYHPLCRALDVRPSPSGELKVSEIRMSCVLYCTYTRRQCRTTKIGTRAIV